MQMKFSKFGEKFLSRLGILQLMDDLGSALSTSEKVIMLGGGNPSYIPKMQARFRERMGSMLDSDSEFERMIGDYSSPQGETEFAEALVSLLRKEYGWQVQANNIALTNGSQTAFFCIFNMLAGDFADGSRKKILLPLAPEYIGYLDLGLVDDFFIAGKPEFEYFDNHIFKYHINFDAVSVTDEIGAICVSRPTNPTGNVLTDNEIEKLRELARQNNIPLIIDNAYGTPFPHIIFTDAKPVWDENIILCMSLSKLGLPGVRTGIVIANEQVTGAISAMNAVMSLAPGRVGAAMVLNMVKSGEIIQLSQNVIKPYYQQKVESPIAQLREEMKGLDFCIHKPEGAFFLWLWFKGLPITSQQLYERLKQRSVVVVPGEYFFPGLQEEWQHKYECIRVSYAQDEDAVRKGVNIIAEEVRRAYSN
jgi:valine--pyruvate aminotransferase